MKRQKIRSDSWMSKVPMERMDELYKIMDAPYPKCLPALKRSFGVCPSRSAVYRSKQRIEGMRLRSIQLSAASKPPALEELKEISKSLDSISKGVSSIMGILNRRLSDQ